MNSVGAGSVVGGVFVVVVVVVWSSDEVAESGGSMGEKVRVDGRLDVVEKEDTSVDLSNNARRMHSCGNFMFLQKKLILEKKSVSVVVL